MLRPRRRVRLRDPEEFEGNTIHDESDGRSGTAAPQVNPAPAAPLTFLNVSGPAIVEALLLEIQRDATFPRLTQRRYPGVACEGVVARF